MHTHRLFAILVLSVLSVLSIATARADDTPQQPAPPPAPQQQQAPPQSPPAPEPPARREEAEGQAAAKPSIAARIKAALTRNADVAGLQSQISTLTTERDQLRAQVSTLTTDLTAARGELTQVEAALAGQRETVRATATVIAETVGQPLASLPAPVAEGAVAGGIEDLQAQLKTEQDSVKRSEIMARIIELSQPQKPSAR